LRLDWLSLAGFRSYGDLSFRPDPEVNLLVGRNGAGKSNLMEAIGYLAALKSFRGAPDEALVGYDLDSAVVRGEVFSDDVGSLIEVEIRRRGGRRALVNKQRLARAADLLGHVRAVTFLPEDLDIVKRGPDHRRQFLDDVAVQLAPTAHLDQSEFDRALRQRNAFLKQRVDDDVTLSVWDERLGQAGGKVMARRARAAAELAQPLRDAYEAIARTPAAVEIRYQSTWGGELDPTVPAATFAERFIEGLGNARRSDRERGVTTVGPHRDEPMLVLDDHDLRHHGSQGEQRTTALSLRLATHHAVTERVGAAPLLLLDDVFSELDPGRAEALAASLPATQTMITTADRGEVPVDGRVWAVEGGAIS
jgi:DNA replication and repair protein RecF